VGGLEPGRWEARGRRVSLDGASPRRRPTSGACLPRIAVLPPHRCLREVEDLGQLAGLEGLGRTRQLMETLASASIGDARAMATGPRHGRRRHLAILPSA